MKLLVPLSQDLLPLSKTAPDHFSLMDPTGRRERRFGSHFHRRARTSSD